MLRVLTKNTDKARVPKGNGTCQNSNAENAAEALKVEAPIDNASQLGKPSEVAAMPNITPNKKVDIK